MHLFLYMKAFCIKKLKTGSVFALEACLGFNCEVVLYVPGHCNLVIDAYDIVASLFFLIEIHNLIFENFSFPTGIFKHSKSPFGLFFLLLFK